MSDRPHWQELTEVLSGELVIRVIRPTEYKHDAPKGARVQPGAMPTNEFTPNDTSYGASAFVKSRLKNGEADLVAANPRWGSYLRAEVLAEQLRELGIDVRLSPQDCEFELVRDAHASLLGVNRERRNKLIRLLEAHLVAASIPQPGATRVPSPSKPD